MKEVITFFSKIIIFVLLPILVFVALGAIPITIFVTGIIWKFIFAFAYAVILILPILWYIYWLVYIKNIF